MRERDYLFGADAVRDAKRAIVAQLVDHHNWVDDTLHGPMLKADDPMPLVRTWGANMRVLNEMADALTPDSLGKSWRQAKLRELTGDATKALRWKAAALNFNPDSHNLDAALSGMTPWNDGEKWVLAVALPAPEPIVAYTDYEPDDIVLIDPKTGAASLLNDANPTVLLPQETENFTVHADARQWARDFATARVEWVFRKFHAQKVANIAPPWIGLPPSALLIGDPTKVRWPTGAIISAGAGTDAKAIQKAIYAQSRTSRVHQPQKIRRAA